MRPRDRISSNERDDPRKIPSERPMGTESRRVSEATVALPLTLSAPPRRVAASVFAFWMMMPRRSLTTTQCGRDSGVGEGRDYVGELRRTLAFHPLGGAIHHKGAGLGVNHGSHVSQPTTRRLGAGLDRPHPAEAEANTRPPEAVVEA
jgi:hypothetical protein